MEIVTTEASRCINCMYMSNIIAQCVSITDGNFLVFASENLMIVAAKIY